MYLSLSIKESTKKIKRNYKSNAKNSLIFKIMWINKYYHVNQSPHTTYKIINGFCLIYVWNTPFKILKTLRTFYRKFEILNIENGIN